jgi:hypothetical protein
VCECDFIEGSRFNDFGLIFSTPSYFVFAPKKINKKRKQIDEVLEGVSHATAFREHKT